MKKTLLLLAFLCFANVFSQGTTQKEYNYLTNGYQLDIQTGRDIISGYKMELASVKSTGVIESGKSIYRTSSIYKLIRTETNKIAAFLIVNERIDNKVTTYFCLPNKEASNDILKQARDYYFKKVVDYKCENTGGSFSYSWNNLMIISDLLSN